MGESPADLQRVELRNWPADRGPGGWVAPYGELLYWVVERVHDVYEAPPRTVTEMNPLLGEVERLVQPWPLRAYLVDLASEWESLPPRRRVLLHQRPGPRWWYLRTPSEQDLARVTKYRVGPPSPPDPPD